MEEDMILNEAIRLSKINYPCDAKICVIQAINMLPVDDYMRDIYTNFDIDINEYAEQMAKKVTMWRKLVG